jgi:hypothetical protein
MVAHIQHEFEAPLGRHGVGKTRVIWYFVLFLPPDLEARLPLGKYPRLRVIGEIADVPVEGAWMPTGDKRHYFIVASAVRKAASARIGTMLEMRFRIDDQTRVSVPDALAVVLRRNRKFAKAWNVLTPGQQRGHCHIVNSAKTAETTAKRVAQVIEAVEGRYD